MEQDLKERVRAQAEDWEDAEKVKIMTQGPSNRVVAAIEAANQVQDE